MKNFYQILGVAPTATQDEIKKAYRFRASKFHPDKHQGDKFFEEEFKELKNAYDILSDSTKRERYDQQFNKTEKEQTNQKTKEDHQNENVYSEPKKAEEAEPAANSNFTYLFVIGALIFIIFLIVGLNSGKDTSSPTNYTSNEQSNPEPTNIWFNNVIHWFSVRTPAKFERQELNYEKGVPGYTEQINMIENYNFATDSYVGLFLYMDTKFDSYNNSRGLKQSIENFLYTASATILNISCEEIDNELNNSECSGTFTSDGTTGYVKGYSLWYNKKVYSITIFTDNTEQNRILADSIFNSIKILQ